jgi:biofilm PGA synthesis protein PgaD
VRHFIIEKPQWQTASQRALFRSVTVLLWALWFYLWLPVLALIGWLLGIKIGYRELVMKHGYAEFVDQLPLYACIVLCLGGGLLLWAYYNYFRFHGVERRKERTCVTLEETSARLMIAPEECHRCIHAPRLVVHHSADGRVLRVD